jgi:hypothetical protein
MTEDMAKQALRARAELGQKLALCATALEQLATVMSAATAELIAAVEQENISTTAYICSLEAQLSQQKSLS